MSVMVINYAAILAEDYKFLTLTFLACENEQGAGVKVSSTVLVVQWRKTLF